MVLIGRLSVYSIMLLKETHTSEVFYKIYTASKKNAWYECPNPADLPPSLTCDLGAPKMHSTSASRGDGQAHGRWRPKHLGAQAPGRALECFCEKRGGSLEHFTA